MLKESSNPLCVKVGTWTIAAWCWTWISLALAQSGRVTEGFGCSAFVLHNKLPTFSPVVKSRNKQFISTHSCLPYQQHGPSQSYEYYSRKSSVVFSSTSSASIGEDSKESNDREAFATAAASDEDFVFMAPTTLYTADPNDQRYSASDWLQNIKSLPRSTILRAIQGPVVTTMVCSFCVSVIHGLLKRFGAAGWADVMCISSKPHSFLVSALGLLLVFRTNSAYQRFAEGRKIWENILSISRNISRLASLYERDLGGERRNRVFRLLGAFPYLLHRHIIPGEGCLDPLEYKELKGTSFVMKLKDSVDWSEKEDYYSDLTSDHRPDNIVSHLYSIVKGQIRNAFRKPNSVNGDSRRDDSSYDDEDYDTCIVDKRALPWCLLPPSALRKCADSVNRPLWICDRLSQELTNVQYSENFTSRERLAFLSQVDKLSKCIGECERIHQTAVPLNYARHSLRSLTIWLLSLPFALVSEFGLLTAPVMGVISWLLFGVYQIGYTIEDPFQGSLRLSILCDLIYRDVMYDADFRSKRDSAFHLEEEIVEWNRLGPIKEESRLLLSTPKNNKSELESTTHSSKREATSLQPSQGPSSTEDSPATSKASKPPSNSPPERLMSSSAPLKNETELKP